MQAHTSPPKVAAVGSAHHGVCPRGIPAAEAGTALVHEGHQGDGRPVRATPCHPKSARAALLKVGEEKEHSGTMRGPYAWGDAEPTSETPSMGPSAAQGAGRHLAKGRRILGVFSLRLGPTRETHHSP